MIERRSRPSASRPAFSSGSYPSSRLVISVSRFRAYADQSPPIGRAFSGASLFGLFVMWSRPFLVHGRGAVTNPVTAPLVTPLGVALRYTV